MYPSLPLSTPRVSLPPPPELLGSSPAGVHPGFAGRLAQAVEQVDGTQRFADAALARLAAGGDVDLHGSMIALSEAEIALKAMVSVRDRVVSAYESLMNLAI